MSRFTGPWDSIAEPRHERKAIIVQYSTIPVRSKKSEDITIRNTAKTSNNRRTNSESRSNDKERTPIRDSRPGCFFLEREATVTEK